MRCGNCVQASAGAWKICARRTSGCLRKPRMCQPAPAALRRNCRRISSPEARCMTRGLRRPEATVTKTYFWAMSQGNVERVSQCYANGEIILNQDRTWQLRQLAEQMSHFKGFAIVEKNEITPDVVEVGMQSSAGGAILKMKLHQVDNDWKLDKQFA